MCKEMKEKNKISYHFTLINKAQVSPLESFLRKLLMSFGFFGFFFFFFFCFLAFLAYSIKNNGNYSDKRSVYLLELILSFKRDNVKLVHNVFI